MWEWSACLMHDNYALSGGMSELMQVLDMGFPEEVLIAY